MARTNAKDAVLALFTDSAPVKEKFSAAMVADYLGYDRSTIDKHLLALVVDGKLDRKKEDGVFMYRIPVTSQVDHDGEVDPNHEAPTALYQVAASQAEQGVPTLDRQTEANDEVGEKAIFFVRLNDIPGFTYGNGGHRMARAISRFDKNYARRFFNWGNTVTSLFVSDNSINEISAAVQDACPEITFGIATTVDEALSIIEHYSTGQFIDREGIKNTALEYFRWFGINLTAPAPRAVVAEPVPAKAEVSTAIGVTEAQQEPVVRDVYNIMEDLAADKPLTAAEMRAALVALAQNWLDFN